MGSSGNPVIQGNLDVISQCRQFLRQLDDDQYRYAQPPLVASSVGGHVRHVVDIYRAVACVEIGDGSAAACIDYDVRRRGCACETSRATAEEELAAILGWLKSLDEDALEHIVAVKTEVALAAVETATVPSTLARELVFASSHAVHHLAIMSMIGRIQGVDVPTSVGVAPATASFLRQQESDVYCI